MERPSSSPPERQSEFLRNPEGFYWDRFVLYAIISLRWDMEVVMQTFPSDEWCKNFPLSGNVTEAENVILAAIASQPEKKVDAAKQAIAAFREKMRKHGNAALQSV